MSKRTPQQKQDPYSNMPARRGVLIAGFSLSIIGFLLVLFSFLFLFVPAVHMPNVSPSVFLKWLLIAGISVAFISTVFAVAGANTIRTVAKLSMFLSSMSFVAGAALLVIVLLFRTVLPLDAIERLSASMLFI